MKYMKVGSKPDIFRMDGKTTTAVSELPSDVTILVEDAAFHLHKFPLLSKCNGLQRLDSDDVLRVDNIPGGAEAFRLCAKFCYGITITLNAHNVLSVRFAAEYLGMSESMEKGNLVFKLEVFLNSSIFKSWKDSIICLKTTKALMPWSQDMNMVSRCIDAIAARTSADPSRVEWSFTYTRSNQVPPGNAASCGSCKSPPWNGATCSKGPACIPKDWWIEDISELDIDLYAKVIMAIKSKGRMCPHLIGEALKVYAQRWLPELLKDDRALSNHAAYDQSGSEHRVLLETIVKLLPSEKGSCSFNFTLRLLKATSLVGGDAFCKEELVKRLGLQLEEATLNDLMEASSGCAHDALYDVDMVLSLVSSFKSQDAENFSQCNSSHVVQPHQRAYQEDPKVEKHRCHSAELVDFGKADTCQRPTHSTLCVAKLVDGYLAEVAHAYGLPLAKFMTLAQLIPDYARPVHDGLYNAIDVYLKEHSDLSKNERKRLCGLMDCKRLSKEACMHAVQNERLPLRVVVQLLFLEQMQKTAASTTTTTTAGKLLNHNRIAQFMNYPLKQHHHHLPQNHHHHHKHKESSAPAQPTKSENPEQGTSCAKIDGLGKDINTTLAMKQSREALHQDQVEEWANSSLRHAIQVEAIREKANASAIANNNKHYTLNLQDLAMLKHPKARALLSNPKKLLNRWLSVRSGSTMTTSTTSSGSLKDSEVSKSSGSSVCSVPSYSQDNKRVNSKTAAIAQKRNSVS